MLGLPSSFDWRTQGKVTSVKNQGACGSCWAFGTVGVMESAILRAGGPTTDLSEQYLINCNNDGYSCNGGWWAHDYHKNKYISPQTQAGAVLESALPYKASNGSCSQAYSHPYRLTSWASIAGYSVPSVDQIKNAIYNYGPVAVAVCVGNAFQAYSGGVFSTNECSKVNHAVVLTGWDDSTQSWIMKNSWGTSWGESGYMRIRWGISQIGYAASYVIYNLPTPTPTPTRTPTPTNTFTPTYTPTPPLPPSPRLIAPRGIVNNTNTPNYQWYEVSNALEYYLEVYKNSTVKPLSTSVSPSYCTQGICTFPGVKLASGTYQFRVKARNQIGWGPNSAWQVFILSNTQPLLSSPKLIAPNGIIHTSTPTFQWNEVSGAAQYDLLATSALNGSTVVSQRVSSASCSDGICFLATASPLPKAMYSFKVRSVDDQGRIGPYSLPMYFRVNVASLSTPENTSVEQTATYRPLFKWSEVDGAMRYYLLVYQDNNGTYPLRTYVYAAQCANQICSYRSPKNLPSGNYRLKIKAYRGFESSPYSDWKTFIIP